MQRRKFFQSAALSAAALPLTAHPRPFAMQDNSNEYYEWRVYYLSGGGSRRGFMDFFENAYIPALKKHGAVKVGLFEEISLPDPPGIYVLIAYPSLSDFGDMPRRIRADPQFQAASADYDAIESSNRLYSRFDSSLLRAFDAIPLMESAGSDHQLYELRTYESYSDDKARRKVEMFNNGEIPIFRDTGLHPVFFGSMVAGPDMPALTYMISFKDMEARDANWAKFIDHPDWKTLSGDAYYANTVSKIFRRFLKALPISEV